MFEFTKKQRMQIETQMRKRLFELKFYTAWDDLESAEGHIYMEFLEANGKKLKELGIDAGEFMRKVKEVWETYKAESKFNF